MSTRKKTMSPAAVAANRHNARLAGRPPKPVSKRQVDKLARERAAVARARGKVASVQEEVASVLILGMRGQLPGSNAQTMQDAAKALAAKGGLIDVKGVQIEGQFTDKLFRVSGDDSVPSAQPPDDATTQPE